MRPDRWRAVVAEVPFVDCVTTMLDPSIPLTINEWDEWGDPRKPDEYACIRSYSPYDNPPPRPPAGDAGDRAPSTMPGWRSTSRPSGWRGSGPPTARAHACCSGRSSGSVPTAGRPVAAPSFRYEAEVQAFILDAMGIGE